MKQDFRTFLSKEAQKRPEVLYQIPTSGPQIVDDIIYFNSLTFELVVTAHPSIAPEKNKILQLLFTRSTKKQA